MGIPISKLQDALLTSLALYPKGKYRNLLCGKSYIFRSFFRDSKPKEMTGTKAVYNAIIMGDGGDTNTDATVTGFGAYDGAYDTIPMGQTEYMTQGEVNWSSMIGHVVISEKEIMVNAGESGFIDLEKSKREGAMTRLANIVESQFWSPSGYLHMSDAAPWLLGPEYWITDDGYAINDVGGTTSVKVGGIDPTESDYNDAAGVNRWRNQYKSISVANQLIDGMDDLYLDCQFQAPPDVDLNTDPAGERYRVVFNKAGFKVWKRLMRRLNEPFSETKPRWNNIQVEWADKMAARSDGTNQGFLFDLGAWKARVADGMDMTWGETIVPPNQPSAKGKYVKFWPALWCEDRRNQGKIFGFGNELIDA